MVFILHDFDLESKQKVIADALRTALALNNPERSEVQVKVLDR
ncbi:DUF2767 family protein [Candidatus Pantoea floridensis]|nr:DUF2767 family protein [Pantoea floridensis]